MKPLRVCKRCGGAAYYEGQLPKVFIPDKGSKYGYRNACLKCYPTDNTAEGMKRSKAKYQAAKRYQVTIEEYEENMATSDCCEICERTDNLCYDHCHTTMKFRGILCRSCNAAIGHLGDNLAGVQRAIVYLTTKET